jgi:hypothetical protein
MPQADEWNLTKFGKLSITEVGPLLHMNAKNNLFLFSNLTLTHWYGTAYYRRWLPIAAVRFV